MSVYSLLNRVLKTMHELANFRSATFYLLPPKLSSTARSTKCYFNVC